LNRGKSELLSLQQET